MAASIWRWKSKPGWNIRHIAQIEALSDQSCRSRGVGCVCYSLHHKPDYDIVGIRIVVDGSGALVRDLLAT